MNHQHQSLKNETLSSLSFPQHLDTPLSEGNAAACQRMISADIPLPVIANFSRMYRLVEMGTTGTISEEEIKPATGIAHLEDVQQDPKYKQAGLEAVNEFAVIRLNGGLGTGMGLSRAKSLLEVKNGLTFNDLIAKQIEALNYSLHTTIPLIHMTSPSTNEDICAAASEFPGLLVKGLPSTFCQHKHPKIFKDSLQPANLVGANGEDLDINWNPPGHGDIYAALLSSGVAEKLLAMGKRYLFVANADNLGATFDPTILGYMKLNKIPFLMETAERTEADKKGGHLATSRDTGRLLLRESAQAPTVDGKIISEFEDITKYTDFNTNNIWLDLEKVVAVASKNGGCIPLPVIRNEKSVDPTDRTSARVYQLETAMGAAIGVFEGAAALRVPRTRFAPVKSHSDLLLVMSDLYRLNPHYELQRFQPDAPLPKVVLDTKNFDMNANFKDLVQCVPSLRHAKSLRVEGPVRFTHPLVVHGNVTIVNTANSPRSIPHDVVTLTEETYEL